MHATVQYQQTAMRKRWWTAWQMYYCKMLQGIVQPVILKISLTERENAVKKLSDESPSLSKTLGPACDIKSGLAVSLSSFN